MTNDAPTVRGAKGSRPAGAVITERAPKIATTFRGGAVSQAFLWEVAQTRDMVRAALVERACDGDERAARELLYSW